MEFPTLNGDTNKQTSKRARELANSQTGIWQRLSRAPISVAGQRAEQPEECSNERTSLLNEPALEEAVAKV